MKIHVKEQQENFSRFGAEWTPTIIIVDEHSNERHRVEGFLPADDLVAQLKLGIAHSLRESGKYKEAERWYRDLSSSGDDEVSAESLYWAGVAKYKDTDDGAALQETAQAFQSRFTDSSWAKKASIWN